MLSNSLKILTGCCLVAFQLLSRTEAIDLCNNITAKQYGFRSTAVSLAAVNDFCTCQLYVLRNRWKIIPASPPPGYRMKQCCTFLNTLALWCFQLCIFVQARGRCSHPHLAEEHEPHGTGEAGCCLETFNVRIGMTFKRTADRYWSETGFFWLRIILAAVSGVLGSPWVLWRIQKTVRPPSAG